MKAVLLVAAALLSGCAADSVPIRYGKDTCAHCRMAIADTRFGAELVNAKGKAYTFDAVECLAGYLDRHPANGQSVMWVTDYEHPPRFVRARAAVFVHSPRLRSPMGANLAAFGPAADRVELVRRYGGQVLTWSEVRRLVRSGIGEPSGAGAMPAGMPMGGHDGGQGADGMPAGMPKAGHGPTPP